MIKCIHKTNMSKDTNLQLLKKYSKIITELKDRGVLRTSNNPAGDYAEYIVSEKMKMELAPNSQKSYDSIDSEKKTYQIKARRITSKKHPTQLGVIRSLDFDFLIVIIFNQDFTVYAAYQIPKNSIKQYAKSSTHQNGLILSMNSGILKDKKTKDITAKFIES